MLRSLALLAVLPIAGCVTDETAQLEHSSEVIVEPKPLAWCSGCFDGRAIGQPIQISTSFVGECEDWLGNEFECNEEDYTLSAHCAGNTCTAAAPRYVHARGSVEVTPLVAGPIQIIVTMNAHTITMPTFVAGVPDALAITCMAGEPARPCEAGGNPLPVVIDVALMFDGVAVTPKGNVVVETTAPGTTTGARWKGTGKGRVTRVRWGELAVDLDVEVGLRRWRIDSGATREPGIPQT